MDFDQLKQAQGSMWGSGPFEEIETNLADMHDAVVAGIGPQPGEPWLDVGCGTGGVSARAAAAGANVIGVDLAPALIETAKRRAEEAGLDIKYEVGDAEDLRFGDGWFAAVSSSVGVMFAPRQQVAAGELARVCAPGGRLAISAWRPEGGIAEFFGFMRQYQPPPPEGMGNPLEWGREETVRDLLGDSFDLEFEELDSPLVLESGEAFWDLMSRAFGPTRVLAESMDDETRAEFRDAFIEFTERERDGDVIRQSRPYLLTTGVRL